jgi:PEP-CTERM motif
MKKVNILAVAAVCLGSAAYADTLSGTGVFSAFNPTGAFWNNVGSDVVNGSSAVNVGNFLGDTGAFALNGNVTANCSTCGPNYEAAGGQMYTQASNNPNFASNFNFVKQAGALQITLLYANSAANVNAEIGLYDASSLANAQNLHTILQPSGAVNLNNAIGTSYAGTYNMYNGAALQGTANLANGSPYTNWGIYIRTCISGGQTLGNCPGGGANIVTYFFNVTYDQNVPVVDIGHQHFALFQSGADASRFFVGLEDFPSPSNIVEGYGDYNDIILGIQTSASGVPEPATLSVMGLGLVGLGLFGRRKFNKK